MANMQISSDGLAYIKLKEQLRLNSYLDIAGGKWTIGWGATFYESGAKVKAGETITRARAEQLFNYHVGLAAAVVNKYVTADLNQGQFDALVSFCFWSGQPNFTGSSLLKLVNADPNNVDGIVIEFNRWIYSNSNGVKVTVPGLITRRKEEAEIYRTGSSSSNYTWLIIVLILIVIYRYRYAKRRE